MVASRKSRSTEAVPKAVAACLADYVGSGARLVVALSGGIDSVVLLHALHRLHDPLAALHVHHGLSAEAGRWEEFCRGVCGAWRIKFDVERVTVEQDSADGLEAAARRARHEAYARTPADWIALGHHRDDRAETLLFNLLRGAGVDGAGAMRPVRGRLLRPLLAVGRDDIRAYAEAYELAWIEDESNADLRFSRNFLRHRALPEIRQHFPGANLRLAGSAERFAEAADLLDDLARADLGGRAEGFPVPVEVLAALPEPRARNVLRFLLRQHHVAIPGERRLREALRQFVSAGPDRHPAVAFGGSVLRRQARRIVLEMPEGVSALPAGEEARELDG